MASSNRHLVAEARRRQEEDLALLRANEEAAPHIRKFLQWVRLQNVISKQADEGYAVVIPYRPTDDEINDLIDSFIELNGEM
jgi:hypothetical protein